METNMPAEIAFRWSPLQPLNAVSSSYDFGEIDSLQRQWLSIRKRREESNPQAFNAFLERLDRSWAIETGIIEGLYTLDRGVTETLVQRGFNSELIDRSATNRDPIELVSVLEDHRQAAEGVYGYIREGNPLTKSFIRQLHVILTEHLPTYTAYDQFGNRFETPLDRGGFKTLPNNPTRRDGRIHEYCPPVQVDSEIDNLVEWHAAHRGEGYHPLLIAAWLHHAFTQIHPFQDGNGRVARALLTWHLVREDYLSVVVSRDDRSAYIDALEEADSGNLVAFVNFLVQLEKRTIISALHAPQLLDHSGKVEDAIDKVVQRIKRRDLEQQTQMRSVNRVALLLRDIALSNLESWGDKICDPLHDAGVIADWNTIRGGPGERESLYLAAAVQSAKLSQHQANLDESRYFAGISIATKDRSLFPQFVFVISLHHVGRQLTGVMAATAFCGFEHGTAEHTEAFPDFESIDTSERVYLTIDSKELFTFTWQDEENEVASRFLGWIENQMESALLNLSERISQ